MSRDFKQEYTQYMNEQTPDLWARIEANLPAKERPVVTDAETSHKKNKVAAFGRNRLMTYGMTAAAALLICLVAVPVLRGDFGAKGEADNGMMALDIDMAARSPFEMVEEMKDEVAEADRTGEAAIMENAVEAEAGKVSAEEAGVTHEYEYGVSAGGNAGTLGGVTKVPEADSAETDEEKRDELGATATEAVMDKNGVASGIFEVKVLEVCEQENRVVYRAMVNDEETRLVFAETFSEDATLLTGETYRLVLEAADSMENWDYVITEIQ